MTITPMTVYWITRVDDIQGTFLLLGGISLVVVVVGITMGAIASDLDYDEKFNWSLFKWFFVPIVCGAFAALIPSSRDLAAMYVIPKIANNQKVQEIPSKILDLANDWLEHLKPGDGK